MFDSHYLPASLLSTLFENAANHRGLNQMAQADPAYQKLILYEALGQQLEAAMFGHDAARAQCLAAAADLQLALERCWTSGGPGFDWDYFNVHLVDAGETYVVMARTGWMAEQALIYMDKAKHALAFDTLTLADPQERQTYEPENGMVPICEICVSKLDTDHPIICFNFVMVSYADLISQARWEFNPASEDFVLAVLLNERNPPES